MDWHDRRQTRRIPAAFPVEYQGKNCSGKGLVANMSPYGLLVRGEGPIDIGAVLCMRVYPGEAMRVTEIERAVVRWRAGIEFGVEIIVMAPEAHVRLMECMAAAMQRAGCVCAPKWPWFCRCLPGFPH